MNSPINDEKKIERNATSIKFQLILIFITSAVLFMLMVQPILNFDCLRSLRRD